MLRLKKFLACMIESDKYISDNYFILNKKFTPRELFIQIKQNAKHHVQTDDSVFIKVIANKFDEQLDNNERNYYRKKFCNRFHFEIGLPFK